MPVLVPFSRRILAWTMLPLGAVAACLIIAGSVRRDTSAALRELANTEFTSTAIRVRLFDGYIDASRDALLKNAGTTPADADEIVRRSRIQMRDWLANRKAVARGERESRLVQQMITQSENFISRLEAVLAQRSRQSAAGESEALTALDNDGAQLRRTVGQYEAVHENDLQVLLQSALRAVMWMRDLLFVCVALLIGAVALGAVLVFRDVVRPLRGQLAESEKLAALGTLAAGIAHEIRNPLTAIKARLYTLSPKLTLPESKEDALAIGHETDRLERIVRDVLGYAHPAEPAMGLVNLADWLQQFAADARSDFVLRSVELVTEVTAVVTVRADTHQLRQIFLNLLRNAQEALDGKNGCIRLRLAREQVQKRGGTADMAVLSVADNGPGMPAKVQARLFDPFFTTKAAGTGLGLSIVARLVKNQGGQIAFESSASSGTCFTVRMPAVDAAPLGAR
jgi:signal transduction histidine kinase